jgi:hypothetical protein
MRDGGRCEGDGGAGPMAGGDKGMVDEPFLGRKEINSVGVVVGGSVNMTVMAGEPCKEVTYLGFVIHASVAPD